MYRKLILLAGITQLLSYKSVEGMQEVLLQEGCTPLHIAAYNGNLAQIAQLSAYLSAYKDVTDNKGRTALHLGAISGQLEAVKLLLFFGANQGIKDKKGRTPLQYAALNNNLEVVELFINSTAA